MTKQSILIHWPKTKINISNIESNQIPNIHTEQPNKQHLRSTTDIDKCWKLFGKAKRLREWESERERYHHISDLKRFCCSHVDAAAAAELPTTCCFLNSQFSLKTITPHIIYRVHSIQIERLYGVCVCVRACCVCVFLYICISFYLNWSPTLCSVASITLSNSCHITILGWLVDLAALSLVYFFVTTYRHLHLYYIYK